jgi:hypothetical protein
MAESIKKLVFYQICLNVFVALSLIIFRWLKFKGLIEIDTDISFFGYIVWWIYFFILVIVYIICRVYLWIQERKYYGI